eukprot:jgi/Mesvir1/24740/Mv22004-RA.3
MSRLLTAFGRKRPKSFPSLCTLSEGLAGSSASWQRQSVHSCLGEEADGPLDAAARDSVRSPQEGSTSSQQGEIVSSHGKQRLRRAPPGDVGQTVTSPQGNMARSHQREAEVGSRQGKVASSWRGREGSSSREERRAPPGPSLPETLPARGVLREWGPAGSHLGGHVVRQGRQQGGGHLQGGASRGPLVLVSSTAAAIPRRGCAQILVPLGAQGFARRAEETSGTRCQQSVIQETCESGCQHHRALPGPASPPAAPPPMERSAALPAGGLWAVAAASPQDAALGTAWGLFAPVDAWVNAVVGVHAATGLPWWAVIASTAAIVRLSLLPVTLRGMRANAGLSRAIAAEAARARSATAILPHDAGTVLDSNNNNNANNTSPNASAGADPARSAASSAAGNAVLSGAGVVAPGHAHAGGHVTDARLSASGAGEGLGGGPGMGVPTMSPASMPLPDTERTGGAASSRPPSTAAMLRERRAGLVKRLLQHTRELGAPHPAWILGSPAIQIPFLLVATMGMRQLAFQGGVTGLDTEGILWFQDLSVAGQGLLGYALPGLLGAAFLANISLMFDRVPLRRPAGAKESGMDLVMSLYKGFLHLAGFLVFLAAAHLPQAVQLYWLSNNSISLLQTLALRNPTVKAWAGLGPVGPIQPSPFRQVAGAGAGPHGSTADSSAAREAAVASSTGKVKEAIAGMNTILEKESPEAAQLLQEAALLKAQGDNEAALAKLRQVLDIRDSSGRERAPGTGRAMALYAMGDIYSACQRWGEAADSFAQAARDPDVLGPTKADYLFRAAVALAKQGGADDLAEQTLREVTAMRPDMLEAHVSLASVLLRANRKHEALDALRAAVRIDPSVEERFLRPLENELKKRS